MEAIVKALDSYMNKQGKTDIAPPEANQWLDQLGLLHDRKQRSGAPLRKLLRAGLISHAYKIGRLWVIPRSKQK